jgi:hypothetical protein
MPKTEQKVVGTKTSKKSASLKPLVQSKQSKQSKASKQQSKQLKQATPSKSSKIQGKTNVVSRRRKTMKGGDSDLPEIQPFSALNMNEWQSIPNSGQMNKGTWIPVDKSQKLFMIKKQFDEDSYKDALKTKVFPVVKAVYETEATGTVMKYIVTERLDGDMTSLLTTYVVEEAAQVFSAKNANLINKNVSNVSNLAKSLKELFYMKMPGKGSGGVRSIYPFHNLLMNDADAFERYKTAYQSVANGENKRMTFEDIYIEYASKPSDVRESIDELLNLKKLDYPGVTVELYDRFVQEVFKRIYAILPMICRGIEGCCRELIKHNIRYRDPKFDNFGYKLMDSTPTDRQCTYSDEFQGKVFVPFVIDVEGGFEMRDDNEMQITIEHLQDDVEHKFKNYTINGQYNIRNIQRDKLVGPTKIIQSFTEGYPILQILAKSYNLDVEANVTLNPSNCKKKNVNSQV